MGIDKYIQLAPYLEVKGNKKVSDPLIRRYCSAHPKKDQKNSKFCSDCGSEILTEDVPNVITYNPVDYIFRKMKEIDCDELSSCGESIKNCIVSNRSMPEIFYIGVNADGEDVVDLSSPETLDKIQAQITWFKKNHENAIASIKKEFGEANVNVRWGLIHYWS